MSLFVNVRGAAFGAVCSAYVIEGPLTPGSTDARALAWDAIPPLVHDRQVFLVTHGFNNSYADGVYALSRLEASLRTSADEVFFGVLWPGDWIVPSINYPFAGGIAMKAGAALAEFANTYLTGARSLSIASHSLGARVMLSAIKGIRRRIRHACFAAAAINDDCLAAEFAAAAANCDDIRTLSSTKDGTLEFAYPAGDLFANILLPDHRPLRRALGRRGPALPWPAMVRPAQIADADGYDHHDYLPPTDAGWKDTDPNEKWRRASGYIGQALRGQAAGWP